MGTRHTRGRDTPAVLTHPWATAVPRADEYVLYLESELSDDGDWARYLGADRDTDYCTDSDTLLVSS